jgi:dTDP-4-dehydrorhamnose reductase
MKPCSTTQDFLKLHVLKSSVMNTRLLVTGGAGFLGRHLLQRANNFLAAGSLHQTPSLALPGITFHICDLQRPEDVTLLLDRVQPEVLIHTACSDQGSGQEAIIPAAGFLAMQTAERRIRFIHLSTDQIFDGTSAPYAEDHSPNPLHPYGIAKAQAEKLVYSLNPQATIIRTSLLYDLRHPDRQSQGLLRATSTDKPIRLFVDEFRCPIWVENLADALLELAELDLPGILHVAGPQSLNRWEFGGSLLEHFGATPTANILRGTIDESGLVRPKDLSLDISRAQQVLKTPLLSLSEARMMVQSSKN